MIEYKSHHQAYFVLNVTDLEEAVAFYQDVLGLELLFDHHEAGLPEPFGWVEMSLPCSGARLGLNLDEQRAGINGTGQLLFYVTDINATRTYIAQKGVEIINTPDGWAGMKVGRRVYGYDYFAMVDPFGNEVFFCGNDKTRSRHRGDEESG